MADDLKRPDESDPLSATAMFLRTLDKQSEAKSPQPAVKSEPVLPGNERRDSNSPGELGASKTNEFTEFFGGSSSARPALNPSVPARPAASSAPQAEPARPAQGPGEFTRIFVKDLPSPSPKPITKNPDERQEPAPSSQVRGKGFSTPGASDAASADASFTQIFRPSARSASGPTPTSEPFTRPERESTAADIAHDVPAERAGQPSAAKFDPSITSLIESLSSPAQSAQRAPEPAPYRADPLASYQPVSKPAQPSQFDAGGVTSFIQRLSDPAPATNLHAPAPAPIHAHNADPGEFTRIISSPQVDASPVAGPAPAPSPAPAAPAPAPEIAFARPAVPQVQPISVQVAMPQAHASMPQAHLVAAAPAVAAPKVTAPHLPPVPAPPAVAAPKGKLESLVPMLLVVDTFLLIVILVVMIFLIKAR